MLTGVIFVFSDWRPALNLAVLDCADEMNSAVCREFSIAGFPTVRVRKGGARAGVLLPEHIILCEAFPWLLPGLLSSEEPLKS